jgi:hypothetical protein
MQEQKQIPNEFLTKINDFKRKTTVDVKLIKEFVQYLNRRFDRNEEDFLTDNSSYIQIGLIRQQMDDIKTEINLVLESLGEINKIKQELEDTKKCIIFDLI